MHQKTIINSFVSNAKVLIANTITQATDKLHSLFEHNSHLPDNIDFLIYTALSGESVFLNSAWPVSKIDHGAGDRVAFPPKVVMEVKALAFQLPCERNLPLSRISHAGIAREVVENGIAASISWATVWRWLKPDAIKPWQYRSWIFPRHPIFCEKASRVLDLYQNIWNGKRLRHDDFLISTDEKTSIQA